jgi:serine O-acetyltransferase
MSNLARLPEPKVPSRATLLGDIVEALCEANRTLHAGGPTLAVLPSTDALAAVMGQLRAALVPWHFGASDLSEDGMAFYLGRTLDEALKRLERQIYLGFMSRCSHGIAPCRVCGEQAASVTQSFLSKLPELRALLGTDATAAFEGDPAASSPDEAVFCYPGCTAIFHHRVAHELFLMGTPMIPRLISELAHSATGIDIHPGASIGSHFFIDHGTGVVVGETSIIGQRVRLYQGVTLGAKGFPKDEQGRCLKSAPRHPIVEDDVVIYAGATVLGRIVIGRGAVIGGNVWVTDSVPAGGRVTQGHVRRHRFGDGSGI